MKSITGFLSLFFVMLAAGVAMAADGAADNAFTQGSFIALAAGLGLGIAAFGGALGQGRPPRRRSRASRATPTPRTSSSRR
jgi:hypothetical protein